MKRIIYPLFLLCLVCAESAQAQQALTVYKDQVRVENRSVKRTDDNRLTLAMDVIMQSSLKVSSNRAATFTPLLQANGHIKALPAVVVYGRRRALVNERSNKLPQDAFAVIRRKPRQEQKVSYLIQVPYESWMKNAELSLNTDLCGCCDVIEENVADLIHNIGIERVKPNPSIAYITPKAELVKHRAAMGQAYLDFPVNQMVIYPTYRNNQRELSKICATIDTIRNDRNTSITGISIEGYASPEGKYAANARLAEGRSNSLMTYVRNYYQFDPRVLRVRSIPEDWAGFRKFIEQSTLAKKSEILAVIDSDEPDYDIKEQQIIKLAGSDGHKMILADCYPALRHSDYTVNYTVRGFSIDETKELIKKQPQQLSLQEIFNAAQTYPVGSEAFNYAFQVAVLMFPNDETANLNAAAMEIQRGSDLALAKRYLAKADPQAAATLNNWGIIAMLEGDLDQAESYFQKALKVGVDGAAAANLKEVAKQKSYPKD